MKYMKGSEDEQVIHRDSSRKHTFYMNDRVDIKKKSILSTGLMNND